jgi:hypothetical protein
VAKLIVEAFEFDNEESPSTVLSMSNRWNQKSDSSDKNVFSSLWTDFQNMMEIS